MREEQSLTLRHNSLHCSYTGPFVNGEIGCSADLTGYPDFAPIKNNTVDGNLFVAQLRAAASAPTAAAQRASRTPATRRTPPTSVFTNNVFQRGANGKCGAYGAITDFKTGRTGNVWSNNTWDNGAVVNPG